MKKRSIKIILLLMLFSLFSEASPPSIPLFENQDLLENPCQKLHEAVSHNDFFEVADRLSKINANCRDAAGNTPVHSFARYADGKNAHRILMLLIYRGFARLNLENDAGETPEMIAQELNNQTSLVALIAFSNSYNPLTKSVHIPQ